MGQPAAAVLEAGHIVAARSAAAESLASVSLAIASLGFLRQTPGLADLAGPAEVQWTGLAELAELKFVKLHRESRLVRGLTPASPLVHRRCG